jgi:acyl-CoA thioesterase-2
VHAAFVAYISDMTGPGSRPLHLEPDLAGIVSLDHAIWFHRPARYDGWLYYELECAVNHGGRSFVRGTMRTPDMHLMTSFTQELIVSRYG